MTNASPTRVLMLATNGFAELLESRHALLEAGLEVTLASISKESIQGVVCDDTTQSMSRTSITPDLSLSEVDVSQFDALVLPGGVANPDTLRMTPDAIDIVRSFVSDEKWVAAIVTPRGCSWRQAPLPGGNSKCSIAAFVPLRHTSLRGKSVTSAREQLAHALHLRAYA